MTMKNTISLYETVIKNGYSVRSGVYSAIDKNITMTFDEYGEYSPTTQNQESSNIFDNTHIAHVCSMSDESPNENIISNELYSNIPGIKSNPILGYYKALYAGYVIEGDYRMNGSSGGVTTWVLKELMDNNHIDGVIHVKETGNSDTLFKYSISDSIESICDGAKTKYYPAELSDVISEIKTRPGRYAIVGIPSFIFEIRLLAREDPVVNERIKYAIGLICGHQKSAKYTESLAWQVGIKPGDLKSINYRKKLKGRPASFYATEMTGIVNGKEVTIIKNQDELFGSNWGQGFFKTKFSDFTDDAMNETADISLGDAWLPEYINDSFGNNVIIVRNEVIAEVLSKGVVAKKIKLDPLSTEEMIRSQSGLIHHTRNELPYRLYKKDSRCEWRPEKRLLAESNLSSIRKKVQNLREDIAKQSHLEYKRAVELDDWSYFENRMRPLVEKYNRIYKVIELKSIRPGLIMRKVRSMVSDRI